MVSGDPILGSFSFPPSDIGFLNINSIKEEPNVGKENMFQVTSKEEKRKEKQMTWNIPTLDYTFIIWFSSF